MSRVYRCYTEKRKGFDVEAQALFKDLAGTLGLAGLTGVRIFNRYDVEGIDDASYAAARTEVFSEPQCDDCFDDELPALDGAVAVLAVESVPGQYNQRADSCAQCIQMMTCADRPLVASAKIYAFYGELSGDDMAKIRSDLINPVESREASMDKPETLEREYPVPSDVPVIDNFAAMDGEALFSVHEKYGLAMDMDDLGCFQAHFKKINRDPTVTELKLIDTYWSDHCRHTTFSTRIDSVDIEDREIQVAYKRYLAAREEVYGKEKADARPKTLMDMATLGTKVLKKRGELPRIDESEEINACSVHMDVAVDGQPQDWLLMFKNETHNHPTEIEPFGGAATCIGGAIRDPLSGRSYVYQAMRITGCGDPTVSVSETIPGRLPQRRIATRAAAGYSSYGNQIGLATGIVKEFYHPGYIAKHMEVGAVVGAAPADHVVRERPEPGDVVLLLGGRTGRDGIGGATGASKSHDMTSLVTMASEVQKGNAPEERKIQRLFRSKDVTRMIRRCNDFGAGGVSVAIGELADGLDIDLDQVRKKYDGLDGTEIAISESQERMAVVVRAADKDKFIAAADRENLECYQVATVTAEPRMVMHWRGKVIVDLDREFLSSTGAEKHASVFIADRSEGRSPEKSALSVGDRFFALAKSKNICSQRGLVERFDSTIGAGTILMPYGGKTQRSPSQAMAALIPAMGKTEDCSVMSFGFDPDLSSADPFTGAKNAVIESLAKLVAAGCSPETYYLTLQEYFEKLHNDPERWGKPFASMLGALDAQLGLGAAAIGGKDSMSGSFNDMDVPPTLISFSIAPSKASSIISSDFKGADHAVCLFKPESGSYGDIRACWRAFHRLCEGGTVLSAWAVTSGGAAEGLMKMSFGNGIGFLASGSIDPETLFGPCPGAIIAECAETPDPATGAVVLGNTSAKPSFYVTGQEFSIQSLLDAWEAPLESVYPTRTGMSVRTNSITCHEYSPLVASQKFAKPRAVIAAFPGTNCETDTARALEKAGIEPEIYVIRNLSATALEESVAELEKAIKDSQIIIMPGGFSGGDEPDGSGKFICSFYRNPRISAAVHELLYNRDGLMMGICNGFQALLKLGLLTTGKICAVDSSFPTLTYNLIGRHQSRYVTTRVASVKSPWMSICKPNELYRVPVSHGEGRFVAGDEAIVEMFRNGQIATQYVDWRGYPTMDVEYNPNGSVQAIEGIFSPDGRVFGKMGHIERCGKFVAKNIPGEKYMPLFESGAAYYR